MGKVTGIQHTDCRSEEGIATGLIDSLITTLRVIRRCYPNIPSEALADLKDDEDFAWIKNKMNNN